VSIKFSIEQLVMQPTQFCNINCQYCYLPDRNKNRKMTVEIAEATARHIAQLDNSVEVVWHGGEPLSCGHSYFTSLVAPFADLVRHGIVTHAIQTNATLINERWCDFFQERGFRVGVSIDGPSWANFQRVNRNGVPSFEKIMHGINCLRQAEIPFSVICVVGATGMQRVQELYDFFVASGCSSLGINMEEQLGVHVSKAESTQGTVRAEMFWRDLFAVWRRNPAIKIREFSRMLPALTALERVGGAPKHYDIFPSVAWNGDVVLLAPEFLNTVAPRYDNFVVGNVLQNNLQDVLQRGRNMRYVLDFISGVTRCSKECEYFQVCYGGQAGNKFFEHGTTNATETAFCRNSEKSLADAILGELECFP
jgi:uncharacterized protein